MWEWKRDFLWKCYGGGTRLGGLAIATGVWGPLKNPCSQQFWDALWAFQRSSFVQWNGDEVKSTQICIYFDINILLGLWSRKLFIHLISNTNTLVPVPTTAKAPWIHISWAIWSMHLFHGRNFVAESGGDDSRILSQKMQKLQYRTIFCPMSPQSCKI